MFKVAGERTVNLVKFLGKNGVLYRALVEAEKCWLCERYICAVCGVCWVKSHLPGVSGVPACNHFTKDE